MNKILFLFGWGGGEKAASLDYILICVPVLSLFSMAKCLVYSSTVVLSEQNWLKKIPQLVITHPVTPSLWKILVVLHGNWWDYTYVSPLMETFNVHAVIMHVGSSKVSVELLGTAQVFPHAIHGPRAAA